MEREPAEVKRFLEENPQLQEKVLKALEDSESHDADAEACLVLSDELSKEDVKVLKLPEKNGGSH